jgi:hypothetical protein
VLYSKWAFCLLEIQCTILAAFLLVYILAAFLLVYIFMSFTKDSCGILIDENTNPKLKFIVEKYYYDFKRAFVDYYDEIINGKSGSNKQQRLKTTFSEAVNSLPFNPFKI